MTGETHFPWLPRGLSAAVEKRIIRETIQLWATAATVWTHAPTDDEFDGTSARLTQQQLTAIGTRQYDTPTHGLHIWRYDRGEVYAWRLDEDRGFFHARVTPGKVSPAWLRAAIGEDLMLGDPRYIVSVRVEFGRWRIGDTRCNAMPDLRRECGFSLGLTFGEAPRRRVRATWARERAAYRREIAGCVAEGARVAAELDAMPPPTPEQRARARQGLIDAGIIRG